MAVYFWYLENRDLSSVHVYSSVHWTMCQKNTTMFNWSGCSGAMVYYVKL